MCRKRFIRTSRLFFSPRNVHFERYLRIPIFRPWPLRFGKSRDSNKFLRPATPSNAVAKLPKSPRHSLTAVVSTSSMTALKVLSVEMQGFTDKLMKDIVLSGERVGFTDKVVIFA